MLMRLVYIDISSLIIGSSIGTANGGHVVVDDSVSTAYEAQPGRQEWVTAIECISATGEKIPPLIIFKGTNLLTTWLPQPLPPGWMFSCNESGWTSNYHGMGWIEHFDARTRGNLQSPDEYRLIICDGHDSHISAGMVNFCIQNRIDLLLLPPHSSHLMQPLDVAVFGPLKRAISLQISRLLRSGIRRIQKAEWLERYIQAREKAITKDNVLAGWRGAGLFPENMHRILVQLLDNEIVHATPTPPPTAIDNTIYFPTSSPPDDPTVLQSKNQAFLAEISRKNIDTPIKIQVKRLTGMTERLQADMMIVKEDLREIRAVHEKRKERQSGKRLSFKDRPLLSSEDIAKALETSEKETKAKKKAAIRNRRNHSKRKNSKKKVVSSDEDVVSSDSDSLDSSSELEVEMLDCIVVS
jgi:DDE superfamily endonuclease